MRILRATSVVLFLLGTFTILVAVFYCWAYLLILVAQESVIVGWIVFFLSAGFWAWQRSVLQAPWAAWFQIWKWADEELERRLIGSPRYG